MRRLLLLSFFALGCGSPSVQPTQDAGPDVDPQTGTLGWATSDTQSRPRNHHMTYVVHAQDGSAFLVATAGVNGGSLMNNTDIAPIAKDGTVGAFTAGPHYGTFVGGLTGANVNGVLVGAGGNMGASLTDMVFTSVVQPDGSLADWQKQAPMNETRMHAASFALGTRIWIMGGFNEATALDDIIFADVGADGTIASWASGGKLDGARTHMAVSYANGFVWLTGGLNTLPTVSSPTLKTVWRGSVEPDGTIDQWTQMTPMPSGICTHSSFVYGGWLYIVGGIDDTAQSAVVRRAHLEDDGTLSSWETAATLPQARGHVHQLPIENDRVYSVSGAIDFSLNSTNAIFVGSFL
jgi:hypothetical protein